MDRPLENRKILITREEHQCKSMINRIEELGGRAVSYPTIKITDPSDWSDCDHSIENLKKYDWIIFTSSNGVNYFMNRKSILENEEPLPSVACVGKKTAESLQIYGFDVDIIPDEFNAENLIKIFSQMDLTGKRILWPTSDRSKDKLKDSLSSYGAVVDKIICYSNSPVNVCESSGNENMLKNIDCYAFFSPSQFKSFLKFPEIETGFLNKENHPVIAAIGPVTARAIRKRGFEVDIMPEMSVEESLVDAIADFYKRN